MSEKIWVFSEANDEGIQDLVLIRADTKREAVEKVFKRRGGFFICAEDLEEKDSCYFKDGQITEEGISYYLQFQEGPENYLDGDSHSVLDIDSMEVIS